MTKIHIETIPILPFGMLNAFLIIYAQTAILVDTGLPNSERKIKRALNKHGLKWSDIRLIVLTHAHIDHAGSAVAVRALTGAPVMAHELEVPYCSGTRPELVATGVFGRMFYKTGAILRPFDYFMPDERMTASEINLQERGFPIRILHTPGHTPGSISVMLDDGRVIAGDLAASGVLLGGIVFRNRPKRPPFEEDAAGVAHSLEQLLRSGSEVFFLGHGGPLRAARIQTHVAALRGLGECRRGPE